jgi:hypothetical protein
MYAPIWRSGPWKWNWEFVLRSWRSATLRIVGQSLMCAILCGGSGWRRSTAKPGEVHNLGADKIYSVQELIDEIHSQLGIKFDIVQEATLGADTRRTCHRWRYLQISKLLFVVARDRFSHYHPRHAGVVETPASQVRAVATVCESITLETVRFSR